MNSSDWLDRAVARQERYNVQKSLHLSISKVSPEVSSLRLISKFSLFIGQGKFTVQCCDVTRITEYPEGKLESTATSKCNVTQRYASLRNNTAEQRRNATTLDLGEMEFPREII